MIYAVQVQNSTDERWTPADNFSWFKTRAEAVRVALRLAEQFLEIRAWRVVDVNGNVYEQEGVAVA